MGPYWGIVMVLWWCYGCVLCNGRYHHNLSCYTGILYCYGYPPLLSGCNFTSQISCYNQTYNMTQSNIEIKPAGVSALTSSSPQIPGPIRSDCRKLRWRRLSINLFDLHQSRQTSDKLCHPGLERKTVESFSQRTSPHSTTLSIRTSPDIRMFLTS